MRTRTRYLRAQRQQSRAQSKKEVKANAHKLDFHHMPNAVTMREPEGAGGPLAGRNHQPGLPAAAGASPFSLETPGPCSSVDAHRTAAPQTNRPPASCSRSRTAATVPVNPPNFPAGNYAAQSAPARHACSAPAAQPLPQSLVPERSAPAPATGPLRGTFRENLPRTKERIRCAFK